MSWCSRKKPDRPSVRITRSSSSQAVRRLALLARRPDSAPPASPGTARSRLPVGVRVVGAGIAVAEVAGEVELDPLREPGGLRHRVRDARGSGPPSRPAAPSPTSRCRAAAARSGRASRAGARRRTRPAGGRGRGGGSGRCRSRRTGPRAARPAPPAPGCARGRGARTGAAARRGSARAPKRGRAPDREPCRCAAPAVRAQPDRHTMPSAWRSTSSRVTDGGVRSRGLTRVPSCAAVSSRQRFE